jgi:hypothetical protein
MERRANANSALGRNDDAMNYGAMTPPVPREGRLP